MTTATIIATGDELINGDITNTTSPWIAQKLVERGLSINYHHVIPDDEKLIKTAILTACNNTDYVFITGGIGPTVDDHVRFALANAIKQQLIFNNKVWESIVSRINAYHSLIPENNRQQAYFPEQATILTNHKGTAAGCYVQYQQTHIFMLPGPPQECYPMFEKQVIPYLPIQNQPKLHWLLLGCSESQIAEQIETALQDLNCRTGYRANYPYVEIKVWSDNNDTITQCEQQLSPIAASYLVSRNNQPASQQLRQYLATTNYQLHIDDQATIGLLQATLLNATNHAKLVFAPGTINTTINITGLDEYWRQSDSHYTSLQLSVANHRWKHRLRLKPDVRKHAVEWLCWKIVHYLQQKNKL